MGRRNNLDEFMLNLLLSFVFMTLLVLFIIYIQKYPKTTWIIFGVICILAIILYFYSDCFDNKYKKGACAIGAFQLMSHIAMGR